MTEIGKLVHESIMRSQGTPTMTDEEFEALVGRCIDERRRPGPHGWERVMPEHDARARYCTQIGVPVEHLRDDIRCPACDDMHRLMHLDPDVKEILTPEPWCESCAEPTEPEASA